MNRRLALLTGTHATNDLYQGLVPALLPLMALERGYSYTAISGLMLAATGLSSVVQPLFGLYADRHPRGWLIPLGFLVAAIGIALAGMSTSYIATWCAIALSGLGIAAYHPPATVAARLAGGGSGKAMSIFSVGGTLGASFAPLLATSLVGGGALSRSYWLAVPALAMGLVWWLAALRRARQVQTVHSARAVPRATAPNDWPAFGLLVAVIVGWSIPYVTVLSMLSMYIGHNLGGTAFQGAAALTAFTASAALGTLCGGWLGDAFGRMRTIRLGYLAAVPMLGALLIAPTAMAALICTSLLGVAMFIPFANQVTLAQDYLPRNPAMASGITLGLALSVGGLISPLFGMMSDSRGLRFTLACVLAVLCVSTVLALRMRNRLPVEPVMEDGLAPV